MAESRENSGPDAGGGVVTVRITETVQVKLTRRRRRCKSGNISGVRRVVLRLPTLSDVRRTRSAKSREQLAQQGQAVGLHISDPQTNE